MHISVFDLFSIGIGPSSSHTVGPMRAAKKFGLHLMEKNLIAEIEHVTVDLYGSLALTGKGHSTDIAILLGLEGESPEEVNPNQVADRIQAIRANGSVRLGGKRSIPFMEKEHLLFHYDKQLPFHPNGMRFTAFDASNSILLREIFYSVGGGFIVDHEAAMKDETIIQDHKNDQVRFPFRNQKSF